MIYLADLIVTMDGPPLERGYLNVEGGCIAALGAQRDLGALARGQVRRLADALILPGLINAHCHLELGMARNCVPASTSFALWVSRLRKFLAGLSREDFRIAARLGALECLKNGITTIVDVGNTGAALEVLAETPVRAFACLELLGLDPADAESRITRARGLVEAKAAKWCRTTMVPHAPFSCSSPLLEGLAAWSRENRRLFTMHVAESAEESEFFRRGSGALRDFCERLFPALPRPEPCSSIGFLAARDLLPEHALLAHCNTMDEGDASILAGLGVSVVHCPKSHAFFHHPEFRYDLLRQSGLNICLGTDGLASNDGLNLFDEMAAFRSLHPGVAPREILAMATTNASRALGMGEELGRLRKGFRADFTALSPAPSPGEAAYAEIVDEEREVVLVVVDGEEVVRA